MIRILKGLRSGGSLMASRKPYIFEGFSRYERLSRTESRSKCRFFLPLTSCMDSRKGNRARSGAGRASLGDFATSGSLHSGPKLYLDAL